jgi:signal transduction histidine kinase
MSWLQKIGGPFAKLQGSRFAFPLAALAALAMFLISESSYQQATATFARLGEQGITRINIQTLLRSLIDIETGQRGYLLTNRDDYLQPYNDAQDRVTQSLDWLDRHYVGDATAVELMKQLRLAARSRQSVSAQTIRLNQSGERAQALDLVLGNQGQEQMNIVRQVCEQLLQLENARVIVGRKRMDQTLRLNRIGVSAMTALSLLALYMYLRQTTLLVRQREQQRNIVQGERDLLATKAMRRTEQLTGLARHLERTREDERNHLARELHDELGAVLTAAKLDVARLKSRLGEVTPDVQERVKHLNEGLNTGIALKRRIIEDLRPSSLMNLGLVEALEILVSEWTARSGIEVDSDFEQVVLRPSAQLTVYRMVQEGLNNIARYANATQVMVRLSCDEGRVRVWVRDNGVGFDVKAPRLKAHGLVGMEYRIETEGGVFKVTSKPGEGTLIEADLPESDDGGEGTNKGDSDRVVDDKAQAFAVLARDAAARSHDAA